MNSYTNKVDLYIDLDHKGKVEIKYDIELETRSWGINGIYVSVPDQTIVYVDEDDNDVEIEIKDCEVDTDFMSEDVKSIAINEIVLYGGKWEAYY